MPPKCSTCDKHYWEGHPCDCGRTPVPEQPVELLPSWETLARNCREIIASEQKKGGSVFDAVDALVSALTMGAPKRESAQPVEISNLLHALNLDRHDIAELPEGATVACNVTTLRKVANFLRSLPKRESAQPIECIDPWPECGKCNKPLWKKSFPDNTHYYEPCVTCEPGHRPKRESVAIGALKKIDIMLGNAIGAGAVRRGEMMSESDSRFFWIFDITKEALSKIEDREGV